MSLQCRMDWQTMSYQSEFSYQQQNEKLRKSRWSDDKIWHEKLFSSCRPTAHMMIWWENNIIYEISCQQIDFCASNPCEDGFRCIDHGDKFSCVCPGEQNGEHNSPDCLDLPRTVSITQRTISRRCWATPLLWTTYNKYSYIFSFTYCSLLFGKSWPMLINLHMQPLITTYSYAQRTNVEMVPPAGVRAAILLTLDFFIVHVH